MLGGVKNLSVGICDGAPSTVCSSDTFAEKLFIKKRYFDTFYIRKRYIWQNLSVFTQKKGDFNALLVSYDK